MPNILTRLLGLRASRAEFRLPKIVCSQGLPLNGNLQSRHGPCGDNSYRVQVQCDLASRSKNTPRRRTSLYSYYEENFAKGRRTLDALMPDMARIASIHAIGVLVIDDIQFLSQAMSGGSSKMLNFFTYLASTIGVPVVLIGTYKARHVLTGEFSQVRRGTGQGDLVWDKMEEDTWQEIDTVHSSPDDPTTQEEQGSCNPGVWQVFLESLWPYQYTKTPCPLTPELSHALYEETQGITDFAVKVYMLAQIRAITSDISGEELLTKEIIHSVAQDSLKTAQRVLNALRLNDLQGLETIEDIHPIEIEPYLQKAYKQLQQLEKLRSLAKESQLQSQSDNQNLPNLQKEAGGGDSFKKRRSRKPKVDALPAGDLRSGLSISVDTGNDVYSTLRKTGAIQSATEFN